MHSETFRDVHQTYIKDESRLSGYCESVSFPRSLHELQENIQALYLEKTPYTVQGARTGISGGAVPWGGHLLCTEKLAGLSEVRLDASGGSIEAECGAWLADITMAAARHGLAFRPDPTETTASIGGLFATGAAGPNCYRHGDVPAHILSADVILPDGACWNIDRGRFLFNESGCDCPTDAVCRSPCRGHYRCAMALRRMPAWTFSTCLRAARGCWALSRSCGPRSSPVRRMRGQSRSFSARQRTPLLSSRTSLRRTGRMLPGTRWLSPLSCSIKTHSY